MSTPPIIERRSFVAPELRLEGSKEKPVIVGYAAVFNQLSEELSFGFREMIKPGAFAKTIKKADIRALWNHDPNWVLGRTKNKTLTLREDDRGLSVKIIPPDSIFSNDILESLDRGDVDQMSFGFTVPPGGDTWRMENGGRIRELIEVDLFDVSPVTYPAYPQTEVQVRAVLAYYESRMKPTQHHDFTLSQTDKLRMRLRSRELAFRIKDLQRLLERHRRDPNFSDSCMAWRRELTDLRTEQIG